jgi:branched-chain amino acid transport system substrate-binding protein
MTQGRARLTRWSASALALAAALLGVFAVSGGAEAPAAKHAGGTIKIGWAEAKTSYLALVDQPIEKGMRVEMARVNANGPWKITLDARDMKTDAAVGATVAQELISAGANVLITTCDTDLSLPGAQIAAQAKIPVISSCGAGSSFPKQVPTYGFLNVPGTLSQGAVIGEYAAKKHYKSAWVLLSHDEDYTQSLAHAFEDRFKQLGGKTVGESLFKVGQTDFRAIATKIANASPKPDVIMTNTFVPDTIPLLLALQRNGSKLPILMVDGNDASALFAGGPQLDRSTLFTYGDYTGPGSRLAQFNAAYKKQYGANPDSLQGAALGADIVDVVEAAATAANSSDGTKLAQAIGKIQKLAGVTGPITYAGQNGLPLKPYVIVTMNRSAKRFVVVAHVSPHKIPPARK